MTKHTNFNRQNNFSRIELAFLGNTIRTFDQYGGGFDEFINSLHGLYDGYYYHNIMELCDKFIQENAAQAKKDGLYVTLHRAKADLKMIVEKVEALPIISQNKAHSLL